MHTRCIFLHQSARKIEKGLRDRHDSLTESKWTDFSKTMWLGCNGNRFLWSVCGYLQMSVILLNSLVLTTSASIELNDHDNSTHFKRRHRKTHISDTRIRRRSFFVDDSLNLLSIFLMDYFIQKTVRSFWIQFHRLHFLCSGTTI